MKEGCRAEEADGKVTRPDGKNKHQQGSQPGLPAAQVARQKHVLKADIRQQDAQYREGNQPEDLHTGGTTEQAQEQEDRPQHERRAPRPRAEAVVRSQPAATVTERHSADDGGHGVGCAHRQH